MNEIRTPISLLESAREMIQDERGTIQIVGRALTPTEEAHLMALGEADQAIASAIEHLTVTLLIDAQK